ncbi:suppressor of fused domain protein [Catellatospora aurea]|uniref:Suppressor of fused domain protein n=1 Tax=Catellatospora aurea TaxID=1337874 RepID=A0ABW2GT72_9ACTN
MDHALTPSAEHLLTHLQARFPQRRAEVLGAPRGPILRRVPGFHVIRLAPGRGEHGWIYVTAGLWEVTRQHGHALEFVLHAPHESDRHVQTLAMTAYYHASGGSFALDHGHTVPIGRPWLPGSACDHLLVSLPYPWGESLEFCDLPDGGHIRVLWLLPITKAERRFKRANGLEALESRLEAAEIIPTDPHRGSVVEPSVGVLRRIARRVRRRPV